MGGVGDVFFGRLANAASPWQSCEMLDIQTAKTNLTLSITGRGVMPSTVCSVEDILDMGYVMAREKVTSTFKVMSLIHVLQIPTDSETGHDFACQ